MTQKNKYAYRSRISEAKFRELVRLFAAALDASQIAEIARLNRNAANRYVRMIRGRIAEFCEAESPFTGQGEVEQASRIGLSAAPTSWWTSPTSAPGGSRVGGIVGRRGRHHRLRTHQATG